MEDSVGEVILKDNTIRAKVPIQDQRKRGDD
jgi:hypothetical protein